MPRDVVSSCQFDVVIKVVKDSLYVMQDHGYTILCPTAIVVSAIIHRHAGVSTDRKRSPRAHGDTRCNGNGGAAALPWPATVLFQDG